MRMDLMDWVVVEMKIDGSQRKMTGCGVEEEGRERGRGGSVLMRQSAAGLMGSLRATLAHTTCEPFSAKIKAAKRNGQTHKCRPISAPRSVDVRARAANLLWEGIAALPGSTLAPGTRLLMRAKHCNPRLFKTRLRSTRLILPSCIHH